ncbi:MAG TPA: ATP-binding protein, partial [Phycisphaerae bacterium]|nr:ATP-binding protein [Phycisphaerae bacterium]
RKTFATYAAAIQRLAAAPAGKADGLEREANALAEQLVVQASDMADRAYHHLGLRGSDAAASIHQAWMILCATMAGSIVLGGVVAWHLHRRVTRPVGALLAGVQRVRDGDGQECLTVAADAEFRALGDAFTSAYADLTAAQERVLQAEKMAAVGKLAAGIAHEVGNPLASISSVAQMMRRKCDDPEHIERLDLIMQHINRASRIVRELLTFSRPVYERGPGEVDISTVLERTVALLRFDKRAGKAAIECRYAPELRIQRGDADRLMTVFTNVMINAFDAMALCRNGDAKLVITGEETDEQVTVSFADNGPGMAREEIHNAFEPFFTTKEPGSGTGLGLWVCYQVVQKHGGTIRIESGQHAGGPGGTRVVVELPKRGRGAAAAAPAAAEVCTA